MRAAGGLARPVLPRVPASASAPQWGPCHPPLLGGLLLVAGSASTWLAMWRRLDCSCRRVVLLPMPLFVRLPSLSVLGHQVSAWWWWWWLSTLLWEILLLCLPRITLTIVILVACIGLLSSGFAAPVALDDAFSEWMLCRSVYAL
uniref:Uncharacterized protein n=1 Tax=Setaria viridis TaxID=4556 RepID=A0A4U6T887_SETVI|nr:hypothetical protein SEVIR_9G536900v2 [Setaria viridis]